MATARTVTCLYTKIVHVHALTVISACRLQGGGLGGGAVAAVNSLACRRLMASDLTITCASLIHVLTVVVFG